MAGSELSGAIMLIVNHIVATTGMDKAEGIYDPERSPAPDIGKLAFGVEGTENTNDYNDGANVRINHTLLVAFSREVATSDELGTQLSTLDQQNVIISSAGISSMVAGYGPLRVTFETTVYDLTSASERLVLVMRFSIVHDIFRSVQ